MIKAILINRKGEIHNISNIDQENDILIADGFYFYDVIQKLPISFNRCNMFQFYIPFMILIHDKISLENYLFRDIMFNFEQTDKEFLVAFIQYDKINIEILQKELYKHYNKV